MYLKVVTSKHLHIVDKCRKMQTLGLEADAVVIHTTHTVSGNKEKKVSPYFLTLSLSDK